MSHLADPGDPERFNPASDVFVHNPDGTGPRWDEFADTGNAGDAYNLGYAHGLADGLRRGRDAERDAIAKRLADGVAQRAGITVAVTEPAEPVRYPRQIRGGTYRSWAEVKAAREAMERED